MVLPIPGLRGQLPSIGGTFLMAVGTGFEPVDGFYPLSCLANKRHKPLDQPTNESRTA